MTLPTGLTFVDNGNGTGTIAGTPAAGTAGTLPGDDLGDQRLGQHRDPGADDHRDARGRADHHQRRHRGFFTLNQAGAVAITTTGSPTPTITETGTLPAGLTFTDDGKGTALIQGTPTAAGTTTLTITAHNGIGTDATQTVTIVVGQAPAFTSASSATAQLSTPFSYTVTTSGYPAPTSAGPTCRPG